MQNYNQKIGSIGEQAAQSIYKKHGFSILVQNFANEKGKRVGEIDFVAVKNGHLHFIEVKTRTSVKFGSGAESVNFYKRQRLVRAIRFFLQRFQHFYTFQLHIDVVVVRAERFDKTVKKITIHTDAIDVTD